MHAALRTVLLLIALACASAPAFAAELVMYRRAGCPWCLAWDREIGPVYGKTALGRHLPLRQVDIAGKPDVALKQPIIYTPTFVVVEDGREVARVEGYPGEAFFWGLIEDAARRLRVQPPSG